MDDPCELVEESLDEQAVVAARIEPVTFVRGDADGNGATDLGDATRVLDALFLTGSPELGCLDAADANDDGALDVSDAVFLLLALFGGGPAIPEPAARCGLDPTVDEIDCASFAGCVDSGACLSQDDIERIVADLLPEDFCMPAETFAYAGNSFSVMVCPASSAGPCPGRDESGCSITLDAVDFALDLAQREAGLHVEGHVMALPMAMKGAGLETLCESDITFAGDVEVPVILASGPDDSLELVSILEPVSENVTHSLASTGGILCDALSAFEGQFFSVVLLQLEEIARRRVEALKEALAGRALCSD